MIVPVPVKPFVKHLLMKQYGKPPIAVRARSDIGNFFQIAATDKKKLKIMIDGMNEAINPLVLVNQAKVQIEVLAQCEAGELKDGLALLEFELGGVFEGKVIIPEMIEQLGKCLESYMLIFMKGFSLGYRCLLNNERSSAVSFHKLYDFDEDVLTEENGHKIIQRECGEMKDPFHGKARRKSIVLESKIVSSY